MNPDQEKCIALLADHGINAREVLEDVGHWGYLTFVLDPLGNKVISPDGDTLATEAHDWPKDFPVGEFFTHYWAWRKAIV